MDTWPEGGHISFYENDYTEIIMNKSEAWMKIDDVERDGEGGSGREERTDVWTEGR